jgi:hypothetical protein
MILTDPTDDVPLAGLLNEVLKGGGVGGSGTSEGVGHETGYVS